MRAFLRRRPVLLALAAAAGLSLVTVISVAVVSPFLTPYFEGPEFRAMLDRQTSKGLHFEGTYSPIRRTGFSTAAAEEFHAANGVKAMRSLEAHGISARFNPWGFLLRRWQLDAVHIERGRVEVQVYEPQPEEKPRRPWYAIFLPNRIYLREVICNTTDITWQIRHREGGLFGATVRILPHGRDFEYFARGGELRSGTFAPPLATERLHMLITREVFQIHELVLHPRGNPAGSLRLSGKLGMREKKDVAVDLDFEKMPITPWLPENLRSGVRGLATGRVTWRGRDRRIESSSGEGSLHLDGTKLVRLPVLEFLASATARQSLESLTLSHCEVKFRWTYPKFEITHLNLADSGKFALRGAVTITSGALSGELELGLASRYLDWLPTARERIFTRKADGLLWTTIQLSGTLDEPKNDLVPRLKDALKHDPVAAAGLFFRSAGEWIEKTLAPSGAKKESQ